MSILDTKIQFFPGKIWLPKPIGEVTLRQFIESHKNPKPGIKEVFNKIAKAEQKEDWETKGKLKQNNLFYFTPCVNLDGEGRSYSNIESFNNIAVLDFDHIKVDAEKLRDNIFENMPSVICAYVSPSKNGVKCLVKIGSVNTIDDFKSYFFGLAHRFEKFEGFDATGQNSCLPLFLSWDENIRWRENPETWTTRGGKYDEFEEFVGDIEEIEDVKDGDKKKVIRRAYNIIKKADEEQTGHPNVVSCSLIFSGFIGTGYVTYDEVKNYIFKWIDESPYLSTKASTYKKTTLTMMEKGLRAPLYLDKHKSQLKNPEVIRLEQPKRDRKYYLLTPLTKFNLQRHKDIHIFAKEKQ